MMDAEDLERFVMTENDDVCMEMETTRPRGMTDEAALERILKEFGCRTPVIGMKKERAPFAASVRKLFQEGISIRQMSRLTGISRGILQKCTK